MVVSIRPAEYRHARRIVLLMKVCIGACLIVFPTTAAVFMVVAFGTPGELIARRRAAVIH